jgi:hypothetical protein
MTFWAVVRLPPLSELAPPDPRLLRYPDVESPSVPVVTDAMPIDALSPSVTFEPSEKPAPPPVIWNSLLPGVLNAASRSNSTSRLLER